LKANPLAMKQVGAEYAAHIRKVCSAPEMTRKITDFYKSAVAA